MSKAAPKITVYMPVYNGARYLEAAINSVLAQTCQDFELIIGNDGSTDGSEEILNGFKDPRISLFNNPSNLGLVPNTNACIARARGNYISCLHQDDLYAPDILEKESNILDQYPNVGLVFSAYNEIDSLGNKLWGRKIFEGDRILSVPEMFRILASKGTVAQWCTVMVRRDVYDALGRHDELLPYTSA
ncbi:MAG: glycosyltransferase family 2 protein [Dehalococcoidia bacterium]|nr:glycosyltransferase family 2 protein [Dehalococcoidia bacterium]